MVPAQDMELAVVELWLELELLAVRHAHVRLLSMGLLQSLALEQPRMGWCWCGSWGSIVINADDHWSWRSDMSPG